MSSKNVSFGGAQDYDQFMEAFRQTDGSDDGRISKEEFAEATGGSSHATRKLFDLYDSDRSGTLELHELMVAVNSAKQANGASVLFGDDHIRRLKNSYGIVAQALPRPEMTLDGVETASELMKGGFSEEEVQELLAAAYKANGDVEETVQGLPAAVEALQATGLSPRETIDFLKEIFGTVDYGTDEAVQAIPGAIRNLRGKTPDVVHYLRSISKIVGSQTGAACEILSTLFQLGMSPQEVLEFFQDIVSHARRDKADFTHGAFAFLPAAVRALRKAGIRRDEIVDWIRWIPEIAGTKAGRTYQLISLSARSLAPENFTAFRGHIEFLLKNLGGELDLINDLARWSGLDPFEIKDRESFVDWVVRATEGAMNASPPGDRWVISVAVADLINDVHDKDPFLGKQDPKDYLRKEIIERLADSPQLAYQVTAQGGDRLYTSSFLLLYERLTQRPNLLEEIKKFDPEGRDLADFAKVLASFNRLGEVYSQAPEHFNPALLKLLSEEDPEYLVQNASQLDGLIGQILTSPEYRSFKPELEKHLIKSYGEARTAYRKSKDPADLQRQAVYGYLIKAHYDEIGDVGKKIILKDKLPPIESPQVPSEWLEDGVLRAKLFFYDDEKQHFALVQRRFQERGFTLEPSEDGRTVLMWKKENGIRLEIIVTLNRADIDRVMQDDSIDIVGHRGHSHHLQETFAETDQGENREKLLYLGSCGSWRDVPGLMKSYQGNFFISDQDKGHGEDNNATLYHVMTAIAGERLTDWSGIQQYVSERLAEEDKNLEAMALVFPQHSSMLLYDFVATALRTI